MRENTLQSKAQRRRWFTLTTDSDHADPIAPNTLGRTFTASKPNEKWVADITYVATGDGWAYMAAVMDLYSRRIVGWSVGDSLATSLVIDALRMCCRRANRVDRCCIIQIEAVSTPAATTDVCLIDTKSNAA